ncbi:MAG: HAD family phosphatase, partial [Paramuribaculum sp.]|nr:HAD family phosphatase [Paramuribaculum sp.]
LSLYKTEEIREDVTRRLLDFQDSMSFPLLPGAMDFLESLKKNGIPRALVTSSDSRKMDCLFKQLPQLRDMFDVIIDASKVTKSKPDPQGYLLAAKELGVEATDCVVFEDSMNGLKAGLASGAKVVGLATTYPAEALKGMADMIVNGWDEVDVTTL